MIIPCILLWGYFSGKRRGWVNCWLCHTHPWVLCGNCCPFSDMKVQEGRVAVFPTLPSLWTHILLSPIIWLLAYVFWIVIPLGKEFSIFPLSLGEESWHNTSMPSCSISCTCPIQEMLTGWDRVMQCTINRVSENLWAFPISLFSQHQNVWIYMVFKMYKWFHFNNFIRSSQWCVRQAIMIISVLRQDTESWPGSLSWPRSHG